MAQKTAAQFKALFVTGYTPTQQDFADLFDSYLNLVDNPFTPTYLEVPVSAAQILALGSDPIDLLPILDEGQYYDAKVILEFTTGITAYDFINDFLLLDLNDAYGATIKRDFIIAGDKVIIVTDLTFMQNNTSIGQIVRDDMTKTGSLRLTTYNSTDPTLGDGTILAKIWYNVRTFGSED